MAEPTSALAPDEISRKVYSARGNTPTAFLLWLATPGVIANVYPGRILLLNYVSQFASRMGRPVTKWDLKAFVSTGDMVAGSVYLYNSDPRYLNLLHNSLNVPIHTEIDTTLAETPPHPTGTYGRQ